MFHPSVMQRAGRFLLALSEIILKRGWAEPLQVV